MIYGMGKLGQLLLKQLLNRECKVVGCIDKACFGNTIHGIEIMPPESVKMIDFDYVIVAVSDSRFREEIIGNLLEMKVGKEKIVWYPVLLN